MGYSVITKTGDGVTTQFLVEFTLGTISTDWITCRVGDEATDRAITFAPGNESLITVGGDVPGDGVSVVFKRTVPKDELLYDFQKGEPIDEVSLDESHLQLMYVGHEYIDGVGLTDAAVDLNMNGHKIFNAITDVDDPTCLATVGIITEQVDAAEAAKEAAEAAAEEATNSTAQIYEGVLSAGQTDITPPWAWVEGKLKVYLDGRLQQQSEYTESVGTQTITLASAPGDGVTFTLLSNTTDAVGAFLQQASNLSDVVDKTAALINIGMPVLSVKNFGAVGNNVIDDTAAIQSTIDYGAANFFRFAVFFPAGVYKVSSTILVSTDNVVMYGEGRNQSVINKLGDYGSMVKFEQSSDYLDFCGIHDMALSNSQDSNDTSGAAIEVTAAISFYIDNLRVNGKHMHGIRFNGCQAPTVNNVDVLPTGDYAAGRTGMLLVARPAGFPGTPGNNNHVVVTNSNIASNWLPGDVDDPPIQYAVHIQSADGFEMTNTRIGGSNTANLFLDNSQGTVFIAHVGIVNCFLDYCKGDGIRATGASATSFFDVRIIGNLISGGSESNNAVNLQSDIIDFVISGNEVNWWQDYGIQPSLGCTRGVITGNSLSRINDSGLTRAGIFVPGTWTGDNLIINDNMVSMYGTPGYGIQANGGTNITISGNHVRDGNYGIFIGSGVSDYIVTNNNAKNNALSGLVDAAGTGIVANNLT